MFGRSACSVLGSSLIERVNQGPRLRYVGLGLRVISSNNFVAQPVLNKYREMVQEGRLKADSRQIVLAEKLDKLGELVDKYHHERLALEKQAEAEELETIREQTALNESLSNDSKGTATTREPMKSSEKKPQRTRLRVPRGMYIHGNVGTGKTMLMDMFFDCLNVPKMRVHLHELLQNIHADIHRDRVLLAKDKASKKRGARESIELFGKQLAKTHSILAFDEFFISDAADAAILEVLLEAMMREGVVLLATSNVEPSDLHESFADFLPKLVSHCKVHDVESEVDYRELQQSSDTSETERPFHLVSDEPIEIFNDMIHSSPETLSNQILDCGFGRRIEIPSSHIDDEGKKTAFVPFSWLCGSKHPILGPNEYTAMCQAYDRIVIGDVPLIRIQPGRVGDESRRFGTFLDIAYDAGVTIITISKHETLFVVDDDLAEDMGQTPESIASLRSFIRARSRWQQLSRGERQARNTSH